MAVFGGLALGCLARGLDTDLWWHLFDGNYILDHMAVPRTDLLSFTTRGHGFADFEWLSEAATGVLYRLGGIWLVQIGFVALILATFGLVHRQATRLGANSILASFLTLMAFAASFTFIGARPQMVTLFMLAIFAVILAKYRQKPDRRLLVLFPVLTVIWSNMHAGFALGIGLLALTCAGEALNARCHLQDHQSPKDTRWLAYATLASLLAALVNPYGVQEYLFPLSQLTGSPFTAVINEWQSPDFHSVWMLPFEALLFLFIGAVFIARRPVNWTHMLVFVAFTALALSAIRNIAVWCVILLPLLGLYVQSAIAALDLKSPPLHFGEQRSVVNTIALGGVLVLFAMVGIRDIKPGLLKAYEREEFPAAAAAYLQGHNLGPNVFATYSWGGYLEWKLYPRYRDFIDGRANVVFSNGTLGAYLNIYNAQGPWRKQLRSFKVNEVLVEPSAPIVNAIRSDHGWRLIYKTSDSVLFARG